MAQARPTGSVRASSTLVTPRLADHPTACRGLGTKVESVVFDLAKFVALVLRQASGGECLEDIGVLKADAGRCRLLGAALVLAVLVARQATWTLTALDAAFWATVAVLLATRLAVARRQEHQGGAPGSRPRLLWGLGLAPAAWLAAQAVSVAD